MILKGEKEKHVFTISLAGVPVQVKCRFEGNRAFFADYESEDKPLFAVEPQKADLERIQADFDRTAGVHREYSEDFLENNAIHTLLAERLVEYDALLMHGSALCMDGDAYVFSAKSGTGKSTHARLWREVFGDRVWMINDDKPMLRIGKDAVAVYGTPWDGKHHLSRNASAPLKAIVNLTRGDTNRIEPMAKPDAFQLLVKQCYVSQDPATMARIMKLEKRLLNAVDFYTLGCNMHPEAAETAWEGMNAR